MTVLDTLNFVSLNSLLNNNPIAVRRRKPIAKIDEQIQLAANKDYTPTQHKWVTDADGNQKRVEVAKRVKRWWSASVDGKINLVVRYESKPLEFAKGKNAIELASKAKIGCAEASAWCARCVLSVLNPVWARWLYVCKQATALRTLYDDYRSPHAAWYPLY